MQAKAGASIGTMSSMGAQRGIVLRQSMRGSPLVSGNRSMRISGRTHAINIRAEKVRGIGQ